MARVTYVKKAQQRYKMVPVIDPATGEQKVVAKQGKDGQPKTTKRGKEIVQRLTVADKTKPLPNLVCDACREEILVGTAYKWIAPKSGPYGGRRMERHESCPTWQVWEYSSSLSARLAQISYDFAQATATFETPEEVTEALTDAAEAVRELAEEKRESASSIEDGFGHATYQSDELNEIADSLDTWADEIEQVDIPELPDPEDVDCEECQGTGKITVVADGDNEEGEVDCEDCDGTGTITPDDLSEGELAEWETEVQDLLGIVDEAPV